MANVLIVNAGMRFLTKGHTIMENTKERLVRYIQDAHAAEVGIVEILENFIAEVNNEPARAAFEEHLAVTRSQAQRLEARLTTLGSGTSSGKGFFNSMMGKLTDLMHAGHDTYDKTTQDLIKAYGTEHLEIGMYTSLMAYAESIGDSETAALAKQIISEEQEAADKVFPMIATTAKAAINATATV